MKTKKQKEKLILIPETDLVASRIEKLRDYFLKQLKKDSSVTRVILDARGIEIVDSLGVNLIIGLYRQVTSESKTFEVIGAGEKFMKIANFFRFPSIFKLKGAEDKK